MKENILPIIFENTDDVYPGRDRNAVRYRSIMNTCSRYNLKLQKVDISTVLASDSNDFDPVILQFAALEWFKYMYEKLGKRRLIINANPAMYRDYNVCTVSTDINGEIEKILNYLTLAGRKKIALFAVHKNHLNSLYYYETFMKLIEESGITMTCSDVFWNTHSIESCLEEFVSKAKNYNAVICFNDASAIYLCNHVSKLGIKVPDDLFVIGKGSMTISQMIKPALTCVTTNEEAIGKQTVLLYKYLQKHREVKSAAIMVESDLIIRESTDFHPHYSESGELAYDASRDCLFNRRAYGEKFYNDISRLEYMFNSCDEIDGEIIKCLKSGMTLEAVSEKLFIAIGTVSYRIKTLLKISGLASREELLKLLNELKI